jgi:hypothetical protein
VGIGLVKRGTMLQQMSSGLTDGSWCLGRSPRKSAATRGSTPEGWSGAEASAHCSSAVVH